MSIYKSSSLAMLPTAYKDGKLYSVRPTDGSGDFTFSRGSNLAATRVASSGYIEKGRENLLLQSNQFDTTWVNSNSTETSGQSGYDGLSDAWQLTASSAGLAYLQQSNTQSGVQTFSVYAKAGTADHLQVYITGTDSSHYFDLTNGTASTPTGAGAIDSSIEDIGSGWYRCSCVCIGTNATLRLYIRQGINVSPAAGEFIYIQDSQLESGLVATDVISTGASTAQAGILEDMPRLDYSGGASCPSLLLESQRTNLLAHSEYFDGSGWNKTSGGTGSTPITTINTNEALSPQGVYNSTKIVFNSGSGTTTGDLSLIEGVVAISAGTDASTSIWLKGENGGEQLHMRGVSNGSFSIITLTTEWQQFTTSENSSTTTDSLQFGIRQNVSGLGIINSNATIYAYGAQIEAGNFSTSYIPTYGSAVTRSLDKCELFGMNASGISTSNNWTYFIDIDNFEAGQEAFYLRSTSGELMHLYTTSLGYRTSASGSTYPASWSFTGYNGTNTQLRMCIRYDGDKLVVFMNGSKKSDEIDSSLLSSRFNNPFDQDKFHFAGNSKWDTNQKLFFDTALTDSECIALTTI